MQIPALCIQPLVENAVLHGVETCVDPSPLVCEIDALPGKIRIKISNPVAFGQTHATSPSGLHLGLANIRERLHLWYGKAANLSIEVSQDRFNVVIEIPDVHDAQQSDYNR